MPPTPREVANFAVEPMPATVTIPARLQPAGRLLELLLLRPWPCADCEFVRAMWPEETAPQLWMQPGTHPVVIGGEFEPASGRRKVAVCGWVYQVRYWREGLQFLHPFVAPYPRFALDGAGRAVMWPVEINGDWKFVR